MRGKVQATDSEQEFLGLNLSFTIYTLCVLKQVNGLCGSHFNPIQRVDDENSNNSNNMLLRVYFFKNVTPGFCGVLMSARLFTCIISFI